MGKRKEPPSNLPPGTDARAAQLRAQIEHLARLPENGFERDTSESNLSQPDSLAGVDQRGNIGLPMLIRTTERTHPPQILAFP